MGGGLAPLLNTQLSRMCLNLICVARDLQTHVNVCSKDKIILWPGTNLVSSGRSMNELELIGMILKVAVSRFYVELTR